MSDKSNGVHHLRSAGMIYMDNNATTPCDERVVEEMMPYFSEQFGNPSSLYLSARTAKKAVDKAREQVASLIGCSAEEIFPPADGSG